MQQFGKIIGHASKLALANCQFLVSEKGRQRVIREKRKNVHAFIRGLIANNEIFFAENPTTKPISYNPYHSGMFFIKDEAKTPVSRAIVVTINGTEIKARFA